MVKGFLRLVFVVFFILVVVSSVCNGMFEKVDYVDVKKEYYGVCISRIRDSICVYVDGVRNSGGKGAIKKMVESVPDEHIASMEFYRVIYNVPPEYFYRMIYSESSFNHECVNSYTQVTRIAWDEYAAGAGVTCPKGSATAVDYIRVGAYMMMCLESYWKERGLSGDRLWERVVASYNVGQYAAVNGLKSNRSVKRYVSGIVF